MKFKLSNLKLSYAVWFRKLPAVLVVNKYPLDHGRSDISSPLYFQPSSFGIVVKCWRFDGQTTYLPNILRLFSLVRTCLQGGGGGEGGGGERGLEAMWPIGQRIGLRSKSDHELRTL